MPVIAMTEEMGSLAKDVSLQLAREMNLRTLRHEVTEHVASRMHVSKSLVNRLREGKVSTLERLRADRASMAVYTAEEVISEAAQGNVVMRGWGSTRLLRPVPHVVCVRITRAFESRVKWLMDHLETDDADFAADEVRRSDHAHAARMHELFGVTWGDPLLYDIVLNTDRLSVDACVHLIRELASTPEFAETDDSRALIEGMAVEAHIRSELRANEATEGVNITIQCRRGHVVLSGIVLTDQERSLTAKVVAAVPGVADVDNQLRVMKMSRMFPSPNKP